MILLDPLNYKPTDDEVRTARLVLEFARQEILSGLTAASVRAEIEECEAIVRLVGMTAENIDTQMEWADDMVVSAVKRHDSRVDDRNDVGDSR